MIDRLIISVDTTGQYEKMLLDKQMNKADKDRERFNQQRKYKWIDDLTVRTFHSFCYSILRNYGVNEFDNKFRVIGDEKRDEEDELSRHVAPETVFEVVHKLLIQHCGNTEYLLQLKRHILDYLIDKVHFKKIRQQVFAKRRQVFYYPQRNKTVWSKSEHFIAEHNDIFSIFYKRFN